MTVSSSTGEGSEPDSRPVVMTELYEGQGLGNQLWAYAVTRTLAEDSGRRFSIHGWERFKGKAFMRLDMGERVVGALHDGPSRDLPQGVFKYVAEHKEWHIPSGADITPFDPLLAQQIGSMKIDGNFESEKYIFHRRQEICEWFKVTKKLPSSFEAVISFRGGEFSAVPDLFLPDTYYRNAMELLRSRYGVKKFVVVTDDPRTAQAYFPELKVISHRKLGRPYGRGRLAAWMWGRAVGRDFAALQQAKFLILSNSSFSWWGAWTNTVAEEVIAPTYWAKFNTSDGYWSPGDIHTKEWTWLDRHGSVLP